MFMASTLLMCCMVKLHIMATGGKHHHALVTPYMFSELGPK